MSRVTGPARDSAPLRRIASIGGKPGFLTDNSRLPNRPDAVRDGRPVAEIGRDVAHHLSGGQSALGRKPRCPAGIRRTSCSRNTTLLIDSTERLHCVASQRHINGDLGVWGVGIGQGCDPVVHWTWTSVRRLNPQRIEGCSLGSRSSRRNPSGSLQMSRYLALEPNAVARLSRLVRLTLGLTPKRASVRGEPLIGS